MPLMIPDIRQAAIDVDPPQGRVPALIAAAGARVSRRFFEFFAVNVRNPHTRRPKTGRQSNQHAVDENTGRRFQGWDISANVGAKLRRPGEGQDDPLYGRNGTAFCRIEEP